MKIECKVKGRNISSFAGKQSVTICGDSCASNAKYCTRKMHKCANQIEVAEFKLEDFARAHKERLAKVADQRGCRDESVASKTLAFIKENVTVTADELFDELGHLATRSGLIANVHQLGRRGHPICSNGMGEYSYGVPFKKTCKNLQARLIDMLEIAGQDGLASYVIADQLNIALSKVNPQIYALRRMGLDVPTIRFDNGRAVYALQGARF